MLVVPLILSAIGIAIAGYMYFVTLQVEKNPFYKAACDFSDNISCTKPLKTKYAKLLGIPNTLTALIFYGLIFVLAFFDQIAAIFFLSLLASLLSIYLTYILFVEIKTICIPCIAAYSINILIFFSVINWLF